MGVAIGGYLVSTTPLANGGSLSQTFALREELLLGAVRRATVLDAFIHTEGAPVDYFLEVADSLTGTWRIWKTATVAAAATTAAGTKIANGERIPGLFLRIRVTNTSGGAQTSTLITALASVL